jgi:hypothetical protein
MNINEHYRIAKTWKYSTDTISLINDEIKRYYNNLNEGRTHKDRFKRFNNSKTFNELHVHLQNKSGFSFAELPNTRWLQDFYNNQKNGTALKTKWVDAILKSFDLKYDPATGSLKKGKSSVPKRSDLHKERSEIIDYITHKSRKSEELADFVGCYKYFAGARRINTRFDYIYEHELEIYVDGKVEIRNPFNKHIYLGTAVVMTNSCLQIISYNFDNMLLDGIGNLLTFKINKYARQAELIPGVGLTFDSGHQPIATHVLLVNNLTLTKRSPVIREYFDTLAEQLRMYAPSLDEVETLVNKYF